MFWTLKVASASTLYFCSTTSSSASTAKARDTTKEKTSARAVLLITQRHHRIDFHRAPRGNVTRHGCRNDEQTDNAHISDDVRCADAVEHCRQQPREPNRRDDSRSEEHTSELQSLAYLV